MPKALIITADIGAGHDLPAELLAAALRERGAEAVIEDGLAAAGPLVRAIVRSGAETVLRRMPWLFDIQYAIGLRFAPTRWLGFMIGMVFGVPGLLRLIARERPDVIVSTYPGTTELLGRLRLAGRLGIPLVAAITDLAALAHWSHPGADAHLIIHAESAEEVAQVIGRRDGIHHVRGLVRPEFEHPPARRTAREALGLPLDGPLVVVSGGGWGVGDVEAAAAAARRAGATVACLCGTNDALAARLRRDPALRVEGFTDRMVEWLAAADVLVHSTAGLTVLEAQLCGTHAVSFGWGVGHIRINNRAYRRFGLAEVVGSPGELEAVLRRLLAHPREPYPDYAALPAAADVVLTAAR